MSIALRNSGIAVAFSNQPGITDWQVEGGADSVDRWSACLSMRECGRSGGTEILAQTPLPLFRARAAHLRNWILEIKLKAQDTCRFFLFNMYQPLTRSSKLLQETHRPRGLCRPTEDQGVLTMRIGVIGYGYWGEYRRNFQFPENSELLGGDRNPKCEAD